MRLVFSSDNSDRLTIKPIEAERIPAQNSYTVNAEVTAKANGIVPVTAQLVTVSGRKVGQPFVIEVQVTQNGTTGWLIALGAGLVLFGTTALRIRTVAREKAQRSRSVSRKPTSVLTSAPPATTSIPPTRPGWPVPGAAHPRTLRTRVMAEATTQPDRDATEPTPPPPHRSPAEPPG